MFNKIYEDLKRIIKNNWLFLALFILTIFLFTVKVPYEVEMPGGTINLNDRVKINEQKTELKGSFNMAYVSVAHNSIIHVLIGLVNPEWDVIKESAVTLGNESIEDTNKRDKLFLEQSKDYAIIAALDAANIKYDIENRINYVSYISPKSKTTLEIGDNIIKCNNKEIEDIEDIIEIIKSKKVGETIEFTVVRNEKETTATGKIFAENNENKIGISVITTFDIKSNYNIEISSSASESGPSGGMMMALITYNALTNQDLTNGKKIVGTGTINLDGTIGAIGGVKFKVSGAVKDNADVFFVPKENYEEAIKVKNAKNYEINIVKVEKLADAINYLEQNYENN